MAARTPNLAFREFVGPIQTALGFIVVGRLTRSGDRGEIRVGDTQRVLLNGSALCPLRSGILDDLYFRVGFRVRVVQRLDKDPRFDCQFVEYAYSFERNSGEEILAFHWAPDSVGTMRAYPHLHLGPAITGTSEILSDRVHKLHVPTGRLDCVDIVRFAIEELDVQMVGRHNHATALQALSKLRAVPFD